MNFVSRTFILATVAASLSCSSNAPTPTQGLESIARPTVPYGTTRANLRIEGPLRSIFVHYGIDAPPDRLERVLGARTRSATDYGIGMRRIGIEVPAEELEQRVAELQRLPWVTEVEIGRDASRIAGNPFPRGTSSASEFGRMAIDTVPWGVSFTRALEVHSLTGASGDAIKVGVLDTGMNCSHPDLSGRIVGGYDYIGMTSGAACTESVHHGTAVAGIIAASLTSSYLVGMAPEADIYSVRVCGNPICTDAALVNGISWARSNNMDLINFSIADCGEDSTATVSFAIRQAVNDGIVFVASAGNGTAVGCYSGMPVSSHARQPGVIAVSAMLADSSTPTGYQYSSHVDLSAPSSVSSDSASNKTALFCCTSAAAPHVTGAAALLLDAGVSPGDVPQRLFDNANDFGTPGKDNYYGYGAVNALKAAVPGPQISGWTYCTTGVIYGGSCLVKPNRLWGVPGFQWRWQIAYSNGSMSSIDTGWITDSTYTVTVPNGEYEIEVKATVRETTSNGFQRVSLTSTHYLQVCIGEPDLRVEPLGTGEGGDRRWTGVPAFIPATPPSPAAALFAICPED